MASMTTWGKQHPDLTETGDVRWESYLYTDPRERAFMEMWNDPARRQLFEDQVTARQREEHPEVQRWIQGRHYAPGESAYAGYQQYQHALRAARDQVAMLAGERTIIHGDDVAAMDLETYGRYFDEKGKPREGVIFRPTSRDVPLDDATDGATMSELRHHGGRA